MLVHSLIELVRQIRRGVNPQGSLNVLCPSFADVHCLADVHSTGFALLNHVDTSHLIGFKGLAECLKWTLIPLSPNQFVDCVLTGDARRELSKQGNVLLVRN